MIVITAVSFAPPPHDAAADAVCRLQLFSETLLFGRLGFLQPEFGIYRDTAALFRSMTHHIIAAVAGVPLPTRRYANWFAPVAWVVKSMVPVGEWRDAQTLAAIARVLC